MSILRQHHPQKIATAHKRVSHKTDKRKPNLLSSRNAGAGAALYRATSPSKSLRSWWAADWARANFFWWDDWLPLTIAGQSMAVAGLDRDGVLFFYKDAGTGQEEF